MRRPGKWPMIRLDAWKHVAERTARRLIDILLFLILYRVKRESDRTCAVRLKVFSCAVTTPSKIKQIDGSIQFVL